VLPSGILVKLPNLEELNVEHNLLEDIPADLGDLKTLQIDENPLSKIFPAYRSSSKVCTVSKFVVIYSNFNLDFILSQNSPRATHDSMEPSQTDACGTRGIFFFLFPPPKLVLSLPKYTRE
jgi:hypothetical protein